MNKIESWLLESLSNQILLTLLNLTNTLPKAWTHELSIKNTTSCLVTRPDPVMFVCIHSKQRCMQSGMDDTRANAEPAKLEASFSPPCDGPHLFWPCSINDQLWARHSGLKQPQSTKFIAACPSYAMINMCHVLVLVCLVSGRSSTPVNYEELLTRHGEKWRESYFPWKWHQASGLSNQLIRTSEIWDSYGSRQWWGESQWKNSTLP